MILLLIYGRAFILGFAEGDGADGARLENVYVRAVHPAACSLLIEI
jgi:hypothetical protein